MPLSHLIVYIVIIALILIFIIFPGARVLLKGFIGLFIKDLATTPEGAEAIYNEKIEEEQERYNRASDLYRKAVGRYTEAKKELEECEKSLVRVEKECESLVKAGKMEHAQLKAEEREKILGDIERKRNQVRVYSQNAEDAKESYEAREKSLRAVKREAYEVVENMKTKQQLKESYEEMDELRRESAKDKLIGDIRDKNKELDIDVAGARKVHESKLSTRLAKAEDEAKKASNNDYLESLKAKYGKK